MSRWVVIAVVVLSMVAVLTPSTEAAAPGAEFTETGCEQYSDAVARLYTAGLGRAPERGGFQFWLTEYQAGRWPLPKMAGFFVESPEFNRSFGSLDDAGFVRQLYRNVLDREGEPGGVAFWIDQMSLGMSRATVLLRFSESPENVERSATTVPTLGPFNEGLPGGWSCRENPQDSRSWSHGQYLVGAGVPAGRYMFDASRGCYWERQSGLSGSFDDIIANEWVSHAGPQIIDIAPTDVAFEFDRDCGRLRPYVGSSFRERAWAGTYLVGSDIRAGRYRTNASPSCYWETIRTFGGRTSEIIDNDFDADGGTKFIDLTDGIGFTTNSNCGVWSRIG